MIYQPAASVLGGRGFPVHEGFRDVGVGGALAEAGLCVRVDDSAWSRPLNIAVQGAGGPFQVGCKEECNQHRYWYLRRSWSGRRRKLFTSRSCCHRLTAVRRASSRVRQRMKERDANVAAVVRNVHRNNRTTFGRSHA